MGVKECWVYPADGGEPYKRGERPQTQSVGPGGVMFMPDLPDFKSTVDGKWYSGRAGLREHNLRNNVVPVEDLKGLPTYQMNSDIRSDQQKRADAENRKRTIINEVNKHYR